LRDDVVPAHTLIVGSQADDLGAFPSQLDSFIGRQGTIASLRKRISEDRLLTIVGPGGCGKTRLAVELAKIIGHLLAAGAVFVDLSGITDPGLVATTVAHSLRLPQPPGGASPAVLAQQLAERETLLVLDNCEHLTDACAMLAVALARGCPRLRVLATSRQPLGLTSEIVVALDGLELPLLAGPEGDEWLLTSEAGALFVDRARRARADFVVGDGDAIAIAEICQRLDGIPLAIELAASRTRMMSARAIADGLSDRFRMLVRTGHSGPPRHKTLLASLEWSWALLSGNEQCVLRRLAVFGPTFTLAAADMVCCGGGVERGEVLELLTSLVDKSLVQALPMVDRFRLHETVRDYSRAALDAAGEHAITRDSHLDYFSSLARSIQATVYTKEMPSAVRSFEADRDNYRGALDWSIESKQFDNGARLMGALGPLFYSSGLRTEALGRCDRFLSSVLEPRARAEVLDWAWLYAFHLEPARGMSMARELTGLGRSLGDDRLRADGLNHLAASQLQTEPADCIATLDEALPLALRADRHTAFISGLVFKSLALMATGRPAAALATGEHAMRSAAERDWLFGTGFARTAVARAAVQVGDMGRALREAELLSHVGAELSDPLLTMSAETVKGAVCMWRSEPGAAEALARARAIGEAAFDLANLPGVKALQGHHQLRLGHLDLGREVLRGAAAEIAALTGRRPEPYEALLAEAAMWCGDWRAAREHLGSMAGQRAITVAPGGIPSLRAASRLARCEGDLRLSLYLACAALSTAHQAGALLDVVDIIELVTMASADLGRPLLAARLLGAAELQRERIGYVRGVPANAEITPVRHALEAKLGPGVFQRARSEGRGLMLDEAVAYARRGRGRRERLERRTIGWASLTPAEREVALLVARRLSNAEIAAQLFVSAVTVKSHLTRVFTKLAVDNRRQLAVLVAEHQSDWCRPRTEGNNGD
jgi:predicted ATPase/DNA-binding CsgD family transcriptional regulator